MSKVNVITPRRPGIEGVYDAAAHMLVLRFEAEGGVPSCTPAVVASLHAAYDEACAVVNAGTAIEAIILSSNMPGIFNMGGDLEMMARMARAGDRAGLSHYGQQTALLVHRTWDGLGLGIPTFAAVDGDAFGGGCEAALSANFTVLSAGSRLSFPEARFGLFPGMGATSLVGRRTSQAFAAAMIGDGRILDADEALARGLTDRVVPRQTERFVRWALSRLGARGRARLADVASLRRRHARYSRDEALDVVAVWVDAVLAASDRTLTHIERIVKAQKSRLRRS